MSNDRDPVTQTQGPAAAPTQAVATGAPSMLGAIAGQPALQRKLAQRAAQRKAKQTETAETETEGAAASDDASVHDVAQDALSGSPGSLPHLATIQRAFGKHDVSQVKAHGDAAAARGTAAMGAEAFASGDRVAFQDAPSLHTAAHEAAHIVQQRSGVQLQGGVGAEGDAYERHADAVADAVVAGQSAEELLDAHVGSGTRAGGDAAPIQRKVGTIKKSLMGSNTVHYYDWDDKTGFQQSAKTLAKGSDIKTARKTIGESGFAWIETEAGEQGYVHRKHVSVTVWGPEKNPRYEDKTRVDGNNLVESTDGSKPMQGYKDTNREWYLDQAVLMQAYRDLEAKDPKDPTDLETMKRLGVAMLQSFAKGAAVDRKNYGDTMGIQTTPFNSEEGVYHRSGSGNQILEAVQNTIGKDMGVESWVDTKAGPGQKFSRVQPVADPTFMEVIAREFPVYGLENPVKGGAKAAKKVDPVIDSPEKFGTSIDALLENLAADRAPDHTFVFDVTQLYVALGCTPDKIEAQISKPLERVFTKKAADAVGKDAKLEGGVKSIMDRIQLVVLTKRKGVDVLLIPPFFKPLTKEERGSKDLSDDEIALRDKVDHKERDEFVKFGGHDSKKLDSSMISSGARIDPIAARSALLEFSPPEKLLKSSGLTEGKLGTKGKRDFVVCESLQKLTETGIFEKFRGLGTEKGAAPYLTIYPPATTDLLAGLAKIKTDEGSIDDIFAAREITEVLQTAYYRIMNAMGGAIGSKADIISFMNHIEVIHDQMQMILAIAEPYAPGVDFARGIIASLKSASKDEAPVVPEGLDPTVSHKASAMHSVASIVSSVEAQKEQDEGNRNVNTMVLRDNYYESAGALHNARTHDVTALDGDQLRGSKKGERKELTPKAMIDPGALEDGKVVPKAPRGPVDLFVCDFHHNIALDRTLYQVEDVEHQVAQLIEKKLVAPKFTVAIDCTVDLVRSDDIRKFLARFKKQISDGSMSVVLFRSAQKFDMLGMDNYYGGYTVTINNGSSFEAFNARINAKEDQVGGLAHQGMAHMAQHGSEHTDAYRKALMANTRLLYDQLPAACRLTADNDSPLQIAQTDDPNNVFLDIQFPGYNDNFDFYQTFISWSQGNGLGFTMRPSFGFATSNFTIIGGSKLRLNPGLEDATAIGKYVSFFTQVQAIMAKTQASQLAGRKKAELDEPAIKLMETAFQKAIGGWKAEEQAARESKAKANAPTKRGADIKPVVDSGAPKKETAKAKDAPKEGAKEAAKAKEPRARRQLGSANGAQQLSIHSTTGDGSCGIHAGLGARDPRSGDFTHADPAAMRAQIAQRIRAGDVDVAKYERMIGELLSSIERRVAGKKGVGGDDGRLWAEFQKIDNLVTDLREARTAEELRVTARRDSRVDLVATYLGHVTNTDHKFAPLRQQLVTEVLSSNAGSDREAKATLTGNDGEKRTKLRGLPAPYLRKLIESCLERLRPIAGNIVGLEGLEETHAALNAPMVERVFGELVTGKSAAFRGAYATAVEAPGYYLRDLDLEVMADVQGRALVIYRESDLHPGQFVEHTSYKPEVGNAMSVYHAGVHYEHAELNDV